MTRPGQDHDAAQEEYRPATSNDPAAATQNPNHDEPLDSDAYEKEYIEIRAHSHASGQNSSEANHKSLGLDEKRPQIDRTKSHATTTSAFSGTGSHIDGPEKDKPWHKKLNPLRWGQAPPVPETRGESREYTASFLSLVYFSWINHIMSVRYSPTVPPCEKKRRRKGILKIMLIKCRLVISGLSNKTTSGKSTPIDRHRS